MADELSTDEKAELALGLWEGLAARLIKKGVITSFDAGMAIFACEQEDWWNDRINAHTSAMLQRLHGAPDEAEDDEIPY